MGIEEQRCRCKKKIHTFFGKIPSTWVHVCKAAKLMVQLAPIWMEDVSELLYETRQEEHKKGQMIINGTRGRIALCYENE